ncbi:MAG: PE-PPE domain-containing protein, partial [Mycobacterium sp.]
MRKLAKRLGLVFVSLLATIVLGVGAVFAATFAFGAVALIVPGTGTPIAGDVDDYMQQAQKRYLQGTACADAATCDLQGIDYPASFWPLAFFPGWCRSGPDGCDKWDESVGKGTLALQDQLDYYLNETDENIVIFGYSQGGAVVSNVLSEDIAKITDPNVRKRIQIVTIGGIQTPDGGLWSRLGFLHYIPILDVTLTPPMVPVPDVQYTSYAFHFDPVADAPRYWGNPFAMINALAALETVHGYYLTPNGNGPNETLPYGYT